MFGLEMLAPTKRQEADAEILFRSDKIDGIRNKHVRGTAKV